MLECSKASADAPIGEGPIVRVGDRSSTFDPALTAALASVATRLDREADEGFAWQRKLMTGGTCEATAYAAFGFAASCVCLPLGNYHNVSDDKEGALEREVISLRDFEGLVTLLRALPAGLGADTGAGTLAERLTALHTRRAALLRPIPG